MNRHDDPAVSDLQARIEELEALVEEHAQSFRVLLSLSEGTSRAVGRNFFPILAQRLAETLGVTFALVAEAVPGENGAHDRARTLGFWADGKLMPNFEYDLAGTPCQACFAGGVTTHPRDVQKLFPEDRDLVDMEAESYCGVSIQSLDGTTIGHICVLDRDPIDEEFGRNPVIKLFAARAGAEMDRLLIERDLRTVQSNMAYAGRLSTLGQMAATIAHEINQPLSAISSYASAARRLYGDLEAVPPEPMLLMDKAWREAQRAGEIIRRLRRFVQNRAVDYSTVDVNALVTEVLELAAPDLNSHGVVCTTDLDDATPTVLGDTVQIQQVVLNLILNAQEAICSQSDSSLPEERRVVRITTCSRERGVVVTVADDGPGFAAEEFDELSEPFVSRREGGMGLGLAISKSIVERHGGRLWAVHPESGGVELCFELPGSKTTSERSELG